MTADEQRPKLAQGDIIRQANLPGGGPALAHALTQLRRVEQERDDLLAHNSELVDVSRERDDARGALAKAERERDELAAEVDSLKTAFTLAGSSRNFNRNRALKAEAELASARTELEQLRAQLAEAHGLVEQIPGRTPVEVLRQLIGDGQDARIELGRLRGQLADVRAAATEQVRAAREAAATITHRTEGGTDG